MRITSTSAPARTPLRQNNAPRFGFVPPPHPTSTHPASSSPSDNASNSDGIAGKDIGVLFVAIVLSIPTMMYGGYKLTQWYLKKSENSRLNRAHERMLANAEAAHRPESQENIRLESISRPEPAVIRNEDNSPTVPSV